MASIAWWKLPDPLAYASELWPHIYFYDKQREIIYSTLYSRETIVPAGNELGKDFVAGFIAVYFFTTRKPVRVVTTSAKEPHLRVLWGEINRFIQTSAKPLDSRKGGPLLCNHQDIRKIVDGVKCPISYIQGLVAAPDSMAAMQGHHATPDNVEEANDGIPRTLFISDESSSVPDDYYVMAKTWAKRTLVIGNPWACDNFFKHSVKGRPGTEDRGGDIKDPHNEGMYLRRIIKIKAEDSPNVQYGMLEKRLGVPVSNRVVVPGVKSYEKYLADRLMLNKIEQCVSLDAEFYEGSELLVFPPLWLNLAEDLARELEGKPRRARSIGIDPAQGGDETAMAAVDEFGLIELVSMKTPNTAVITGQAIAFMNKHGVSPENVVFDLGGGGKEHADRLRSQGYNVRTVAFGETVAPPPRRGRATLTTRKDEREEKYSYFNRRAQMYGELRLLMDPSLLGTKLEDIEIKGFAIPKKYSELRRQLAPIPLKYDPEGRLKMLPKNKRSADSTEVSLTELIGCSPDQADALVLAVHAMLHKERKKVFGAAY